MQKQKTKKLAKHFFMAVIFKYGQIYLMAVSIFLIFALAMKNKVVLITGASSGIGYALAHKYAQEGFQIVLAARNVASLANAADTLKTAEDQIKYIKTDVRSEDDCKKAVEFTINSFGKLDILICNAGISMRALFTEVEISVLKQLMDVNFWGTVYFAKYALPYLLQSKGSLVGVSSIAGKKGLPARSAYSASKFAMEGLLETIRIENLEKGLHVLVACPGFTTSNIRNSALSASGRPQAESPRNEDKMMSAEEVAKHIFDAVIKRKRDLVLTRQGKITVYLNKFFPSLLDKLVLNHMKKEANSPLK